MSVHVCVCEHACVCEHDQIVILKDMERAIYFARVLLVIVAFHHCESSGIFSSPNFISVPRLPFQLSVACSTGKAE